jgi:sterol 3beta-glucosyltransferase
MKIVMLTIGTRGEVQPLVALGLGLQAAGHQVVIATHGMFETFVREAGLGFSLIRFDPQEFLSSETGQAILSSGRNPARTFRIFVSEMKAMVLGMGTDCWAACQEAKNWTRRR